MRNPLRSHRKREGPPDFTKMPLVILREGLNSHSLWADLSVITVPFILLTLFTFLGWIWAAGFLVFVLLMFLIEEKVIYEKLIITEKSVTVNKRDLLGKYQWTSSIDSFQSVRLRTVTSETKSTNQVHILELIHPSPSRCLVLYATKQEYKIRRVWTAAAEILHLPTERITSEDVSAREARMYGWYFSGEESHEVGVGDADVDVDAGGHE